MHFDTNPGHDDAGFLESLLRRHADAVERGTRVPHLDELRRQLFVYATATKGFAEAEAREWAKARIEELARAMSVPGASC